MSSILNIAIVLLLIMAAIIGFKKGFIKSAVTLAGTIIVIILAFILKNPISILLYKYAPFFKFGGTFEGISVINILIYESLSFLIVISVLSILLNIIIKLSGVIEKVLKATIILGIPSKLLGLVLGFIEGYIFIFIALFIMSQFTFTSGLIRENSMATGMLKHTPILSRTVKGTYNSVIEIYDVTEKYQNDIYKGQANKEAFEILLKHKIISTDNATYLVENNKVEIKNAQEIIEKYEGE